MLLDFSILLFRHNAKAIHKNNVQKIENCEEEESDTSL